MKICPENPHLVKIGKKYRALYLQTSVRVTVEALSSSEMVSGCQKIQTICERACVTCIACFVTFWKESEVYEVTQ